MGKMKMNKRGFEFSFAWLFSIIVGAAIIFIAVFVVVNLVNTGRFQTDSEVALQLGTLLNPVETNLESGRYAVIEFPVETRVFNSCRELGNFGEQGISAATRSGIGKEFQNPGVESVFFNKYLFSNGVEQGEELHLFVKPLELPYKVADMIFAFSGEYCFVNPPGEIEDEVDSLNIRNIIVSSSVSECPVESKKVCFTSTNCDIDVNLQSQSVGYKNSEKRVYYEDDLLYGAIFSNPEIYECQITRLMKRNGELAHLYAEKTNFLSVKGCSSNLGGQLTSFASEIQIGQDENSRKLQSIKVRSKEIERRNGLLSCKLF